MLDHGAEPRAGIGVELAQLLGCDRAGQQAPKPVKQAQVERQLLGPVPGLQLHQVSPHPLGLGRAEIKIAIEPPVGDFWRLVVAHPDSTAAGQ